MRCMDYQSESSDVQIVGSNILRYAAGLGGGSALGECGQAAFLDPKLPSF